MTSGYASYLDLMKMNHDDFLDVLEILAVKNYNEVLVKDYYEQLRQQKK